MLVELDTRQERAQLAAMEAQRDFATCQFQPYQGAGKCRASSPELEFDNVTAQQKSTEAKVGEIRATIERKTIRAPFSGVLGIRQVNLGQYLVGGAGHCSAASSESDLCELRRAAAGRCARCSVGRTLRVSKEDLPSVAFSGRVTAIDSVVNEATRNIQVQATLANPRRQTASRDVCAGGGGYWVQADPSSHFRPPRSTTRRTAIRSSSSPTSRTRTGKTYRGVRQQFVKLEGSRGDQVAVVSGVKPGDEVVTSGVFKLRNGAAVQVNNKVQPGNNPTPKPEDS